MPCRFICDVHQWINERSTVLDKDRLKTQPRERARCCQRGKKTLMSLTSDLKMSVINMLFVTDFSSLSRPCVDSIP